jgi:ATP-dependent DNA helicase RecG
MLRKELVSGFFMLNSLVHRDYFLSTSTLISIYDDRIEFVSVGGLIQNI